jgi:hypothetical protein
VGALKQAHVGLALLGGFGGANTAKIGEDLMKEDSEEEKNLKNALALSKNQERAAKMKEHLTKDNKGEVLCMLIHSYIPSDLNLNYII